MEILSSNTPYRLLKVNKGSSYSVGEHEYAVVRASVSIINSQANNTFVNIAYGPHLQQFWLNIAGGVNTLKVPPGGTVTAGTNANVMVEIYRT